LSDRETRNEVTPNVNITVISVTEKWHQESNAQFCHKKLSGIN